MSILQILYILQLNACRYWLASGPNVSQWAMLNPPMPDGALWYLMAKFVEPCTCCTTSCTSGAANSGTTCSCIADFAKKLFDNGLKLALAVPSLHSKPLLS